MLKLFDFVKLTIMQTAVLIKPIFYKKFSEILEL